MGIAEGETEGATPELLGNTCMHTTDAAVSTATCGLPAGSLGSNARGGEQILLPVLWMNCCLHLQLQARDRAYIFPPLAKKCRQRSGPKDPGKGKKIMREGRWNLRYN